MMNSLIMEALNDLTRSLSTYRDRMPLRDTKEDEVTRERVIGNAYRVIGLLGLGRGLPQSLMVITNERYARLAQHERAADNGMRGRTDGAMPAEVPVMVGASVWELRADGRVVGASNRGGAAAIIDAQLNLPAQGRLLRAFENNGGRPFADNGYVLARVERADVPMSPSEVFFTTERGPTIELDWAGPHTQGRLAFLLHEALINYRATDFTADTNTRIDARTWEVVHGMMNEISRSLGMSIDGNGAPRDAD